MSFLYPQFLWALTALSIPLLIHLFNFRRYKTIYFSNTSFLQSAQKNSKAINRLRQWLIMLARMLALAALVMAFAQPYLSDTNGAAAKHHKAVLYIDNSPSMKVAGQEGDLLNEARIKAVELLKTLPQSFTYHIITNSFTQSGQRFYPRTEAIDQIDKMETSHLFRTAHEIQERIKGAVGNTGADSNEVVHLFILSDFPKNAWSTTPSFPPGWRLHPMPLQPLNPVENVAIDSLWLDKPVLIKGLPQKLTVRIKNYGSGKASNIPVQLMLNGKRSAFSSVNIPAGGFAEEEFEFYPENEKALKAEVRIEHGAYHFDNRFYAYMPVNKPKNVTITAPNPQPKTLVANFKDSIFNITVTSTQALDYQSLSQQDLIIIHGLESISDGLIASLRQSFKAGRNVILIPNNDNLAPFNTLLGALKAGKLQPQQEIKLRANALNYRDPYFKNTFVEEVDNPDLPVVRRYFGLQSNSGYTLLSLENGQPLVVRVPIENGQLFISAVSIADSASSLWRHPVARPLLMNAALYSGRAGSLYLQGGRQQAYQEINDPGQSESPLHLLINEQQLIPPQRHQGNRTRVFLPPGGVASGLYAVQRKDSTMAYLSVNVDARESEAHLLNRQDIAQKLGIAESAILESSNASGSYTLATSIEGVPLWKWFIGGALLFLALEMLFIKIKF